MTENDQRASWAPHPAAPPPSAAAFPPYGGSPPYGTPAGYAAAPLEVRVLSPASTGHRLAVLGVVLGGLALVGVLLLVVLALAVSFLGPGGGGGYGSLRGTIVPVPGSALAGQALADEVTRKVLDDGGHPEGISCPATARVAQDVTTVCHGSDDGTVSSFVVFFEDETGDYTLLEI